MRLLEARNMQFHEFASDPPPYAILSHTWGLEEASYQDMMNGRAKEKKGFAKIQACCKQALVEGIEYAWVDTCCIDKTSSTELSEAINSMFQWYAASAVCYAYLSDVYYSLSEETEVQVEEASQDINEFSNEPEEQFTKSNGLLEGGLCRSFWPLKRSFSSRPIGVD